MSTLPKLKIKIPSGRQTETEFELEDARRCLDFNSWVFLIDGHRIRSYEKLIEFINRDDYKNKEYIEVVGLPPIFGG